MKKRILKSALLRGTIILTLTGFLTRFLGFYNRIFLNDKIGATQLGLYQLILPVYMLTFALTTYGKEVALTKIVSALWQQKNYLAAKRYLKICLFVSSIHGIIIGILLYIYSPYICLHFLHTPDCVDCLRILSFGIPFMAAKGAIHGFFLGKSQSGIHGASDLIEQSTKILSLCFLSSFVLVQKNYSASFACLGIICGEVLSFLFCMISLLADTKKESNNQTPTSSSAANSIYSINASMNNKLKPTTMLRTLINTALPLTLNRFSFTIFQSIEAILIPTVLLHYYHESSTSLSIYGLFSGIAFPCILFPSTVTNALSTMLLPMVSADNEKSCKQSLVNLCEKSIQICMLIGIYAMIIFFQFGAQIGSVFFHSSEAGQYVCWLSILCPFLYLATTLASILNGLGYSTHNLTYNLIATSIRILFLIFLIPKIGIIGYVLGLFCSYCVLTLFSLTKVQQYIPFQIRFRKWLLFPFLYMLCINAGACHLYNQLTSLQLLTQPVLLLGTLGLSSLISLFPFAKKLLHISFCYRLRNQ